MNRYISVPIRIAVVIVILFSIPTLAKSHEPDPNEPWPGGRSPDGLEKTTIPSKPGSLVVQDLTSGITSEQLADTLVGQGISVSNILYQGSNISAGQFSGGTEIVGFDTGIILSSGAVVGTIGPNQSDRYSTNLALDGDPDLTALAGYPTYDATVLEFDFVPDRDQVSFQFAFTSEEYNEYVYTEYNDVFAFYINGQNCALIDGDPISINTINNGNPYGSSPNSHPGFYLNNDLSDGGGSYDTEMDGLTFVLTCASSVTPDQTNHMKLAIADASDHIWDSAVFIRAGSITTERIPVILIPGMGASFNATCFFNENFCNTDLLWTWMPVAAEPVYKPLIDRLAEAGYTEDNQFFSIFFYDWRKPIDDNVNRLKEQIDEIKENTGKDNVDLIGHSMGGLLARTYVQSGKFGYDVAHVVTLGSPHQGAAKAYPFWEAAYVYEMGTMESIASNLLLIYYMYREKNLVQVLVLRDKIASFKDILPIYDDILDDSVINYLYRDDTNAPIPENTLNHRNTFMHNLNAGLDTLFNRTEVATFVGKDEQTTARFYVDDWTIWNLYNWVDGEPNWDRRSEFYSNNGDGTVLVVSGVLESAYVRNFSGVNHGELPGNNNVINAIFAYLGITVAPSPVPSIIPRILIIIVDGAAQGIITDPQGRSVYPPGLIGSTATGVINDTIPGAEYIQVPDNSFKFIMIPEPLSGDYQIAVTGVGEGEFTLGRLDTFTDTLGVPAPADSFWDLSESQIQPSTTLTYTLNYSETAYLVGNLVAVTPVIELPVWMGNTVVNGRGQPGVEVTIYDVASGSVLGAGAVGENGHFAIALTQPLVSKQRIYATSDGQIGSIVTVGSNDIFVPLILD